MNRIRFLIFTFLIAAIPSVTHSANHYIRAGAAGNNSGTDWTNAFSSLPATLTRGDTYFIADGNYASYLFDDPVNGEKYITIKKATINDHGTNTGWDNSYGDGTAIFRADFSFTTDFWIIDGQIRKSWTEGYGFKIDNSAAGQQRSVDLYLTYPPVAFLHSITLKYIEIQGHGLDNSVYDDGIYAPNRGDHITVSHCYLHDFGRAPFITGELTSFLLEYCYIARNSNSAAVHSEGLADSNSDSVTIRYNVWADIEGTGYIVCLNRDNYTGTVENWNIYGNIFFKTIQNTYDRGGVGEGVIAIINKQSAINWKIYNNSIINIKSDGSSARIRFADEDPSQNHQKTYVYNNLWYNCGNADHYGVTVSDYNFYMATTHSNELHQQNFQTTDSSIFIDYYKENFRLAGETAAALSFPSPFDQDMDGNLRGSDGKWDRGAYEYEVLQPPTKLRFVR